MAIKPQHDEPLPEGLVAGMTSLMLKSSLKPAEPPYKRELFELREGRCDGCKLTFEFDDLHLEHIIPRVAGGTYDIDNLLLLCRPCSRGEGNLSREYIIARLRKLGVEL